MKKFTLLLAMLLCLVPVLASCGGASSAEAAVTTWLDAVYDDGGADVEDVYAVKLAWNLDVLDLIDNEDKAAELEDGVRAAREGAKDKINEMEDIEETIEENKWDDCSVAYEVIYCNEYDKDSDTFDDAKGGFMYKGTAIEDELTSVAAVGVLVTREIEKDGEIMTMADVETFTVYCVDGNWYIG